MRFFVIVDISFCLSLGVIMLYWLFVDSMVAWPMRRFVYVIFLNCQSILINTFLSLAFANPFNGCLSCIECLTQPTHRHHLTGQGMEKQTGVPEEHNLGFMVEKGQVSPGFLTGSVRQIMSGWLVGMYGGGKMSVWCKQLCSVYVVC